ncbi:uncharacterized protein LOC130589467 [Beta vulgaris subsp. vulgaris]|uniref:uncharacterized protein LOC130589467 n=1 Tax=Beta vulgaris subsp. vulgaris TaxID=3555 RepID=UPI0025467651|nr:uncharacterized protein LOC130589467 [Beta vulgaris subsp. vulgaris]
MLMLRRKFIRRKGLRLVVARALRSRQLPGKSAESSKGKEIMEHEPETERFPADKKRKGTPINLSEKSLADILKVPHKGLDEYSRENWPTVKGLTAEQIQIHWWCSENEKSAKGDAIGEGTSTESVQATYALVKQLSDQNQMMQNMLNSVTQLCTALQESYKRVEVRLDKAGIQGREDSEEKDESSHAAGDEDDEEEEQKRREEQEEEEEEAHEEDASENLEEEEDDGTENDSGADFLLSFAANPSFLKLSICMRDIPDSLSTSFLFS